MQSNKTCSPPNPQFANLSIGSLQLNCETTSADEKNNRRDTGYFFAQNPLFYYFSPYTKRLTTEHKLYSQSFLLFGEIFKRK